MRTIVEEFMKSTKITETPNKTVEAIMSYLTDSKSIATMIMMSEIGQPALSGVVKELENKFANSDFPLYRDSKDSNAPNRRNVGWMIKYIMREFGYTPKNSSLVRIGKYSGSKHFGYSTVYEKTNPNPNYKLVIEIEPNNY